MTHDTQQLVDHFFRREYGKLVSTLSRVFGLRHIERVEDMVQAAFIEALQAWRIHGPPKEPAKWIYRVAKNRMLDTLRRDRTAARLAPQWASLRETDVEFDVVDDLFLDSNLKDSQLRMIFACCHPFLAPEDRVALTLRSLCGFSNSEIARALLVQEETIRKRIYRAKQQLKEEDVGLEVPVSEDLPNRLSTVHQVLYLVFNEGYSPSSGTEAVKSELCEEAARLCHMLCEHDHCSIPATNALLSLMLFHSSRLDARIDSSGGVLLLEEQDRTKWDQRLIAEANRYLARSYESRAITHYHLEAAIAMYHSTSADFESTPWESILQLYDSLIARYDSPIYLLNRAIVVAQINGPTAGIDAIEELQSDEKLQGYHLVDATLGELYARTGAIEKARRHFQKALNSHPSKAESDLLQQKMDGL